MKISPQYKAEFTVLAGMAVVIIGALFFKITGEAFLFAFLSFWLGTIIGKFVEMVFK